MNNAVSVESASLRVPFGCEQEVQGSQDVAEVGSLL